MATHIELAVLSLNAYTPSDRNAQIVIPGWDEHGSFPF